MRVISLDRLRVLSSVGILPHEMESKQPLLISIGVDLPDAPTLPVQDDVRHVLDYRQLRDIAKAESEGGHVNMLETLAGRIATRLLALPGVGCARVRVVKPSIFPDSDGIAVEITAQRDADAPRARS